MTYLLWGLLNIGLFLFFTFTCFRATKLLRDQFGLFATIIFVFGLFSFIGNANDSDDNKEQDSNGAWTWKFIADDSVKRNATYSLNIDLEKTFVSEYTLAIKYGKDINGQVNIPISAYATTSGFSSGTNWKPVSIIVSRTADNHQFQYYVDGMMEWKLLGATIYSQSKEFKGFALIK